MAATEPLLTSTNSGTQTTTQSPQSSPVPQGFSGAQTSTVQPSTAASLLNGTGGVPLTPTGLSTVSLGTSTTTTTSAAVATTPHKINAGLMGIALVFFVAAIVLFVYISRSAKNTTI